MARRSGVERLWSPWRMGYVRRAAEPAGCIFCRAARTRTDRASLVVLRRPNALVMLNRFPYNPAHLMVAVTRHVGDLGGVNAAERDGLFELLALAERVLKAEYRPDGLNVGANLGRVAGAGFPGHLHLHIVPRWDGDTNFMPVVGETKVLPESLDATWRRLRKAFAAPVPRRPARSRRG
jgi:ATP adenylyltransferase